MPGIGNFQSWFTCIRNLPEAIKEYAMWLLTASEARQAGLQKLHLYRACSLTSRESWQILKALSFVSKHISFAGIETRWRMPARKASIVLIGRAVQIS